MTDEFRFEARLTEALGRYAERGPVEVDPAELTAAVRGAVRHGPVTFAVGRPAWGVAALLLALAALAIIVGALLTNRPIPLPGGGILIWSGAWTGSGTAYVVGADGRTIQSVDLPGVQQCPHLIADGRSIAYWSDDSTLRVVAPGATPSIGRVLASFPMKVVPFDTWSDDGGWIAIRLREPATESGVTVVSTADGTTSRIAISATGAVVSVQWAHDGERLALARQIGSEISIETVNRDGSDLRRVGRIAYDSASAGYPQLVWSSDGARIGVAVPPGGPLAVLDIATGRVSDPAGEARFSASVRSDLAWVSPDGTSIARFDTQDLVITDTAGHELGRQRLGAPAHDLVWSPDSRAIAVSRTSTGESVRFDVFSVAGDRPPATLGPFAGRFGDPVCMSWLGS